jgi:hypothetical protein
MKKLGFDPAPCVLAFVLGSLLESSLRRSLLMFDGNPAQFLVRPISARHRDLHRGRSAPAREEGVPSSTVRRWRPCTHWRQRPVPRRGFRDEDRLEALTFSTAAATGAPAEVTCVWLLQGIGSMGVEPWVWAATLVTLTADTPRRPHHYRPPPPRTLRWASRPCGSASYVAAAIAFGVGIC